MRLYSFYSVGLAAMALAALVDPPNAYPQTASAGSTSNSSAGASSGSSSGSAAIINTGGGAFSAPGGNTTTTNSTNNPPAPSDVIVRSAPQVFAPPVVLGGNICALGASAGASWLGAGVAFGGSWESVNCERRQQAALLYNMGDKRGARELLCSASKEIYEAQRTAGTPCAIRPEWEPKVAGVQPVPLQPVPPPMRTSERAAFNPAYFPSGSECLNAASAAGVPLTECAGKR
jgi:hypothetical protein